MQAVLLAAGKSTRTLPLTSTRPKPLLPVWGIPLLERQLEQLHALVDEVVLVVGYRKEQILDRFGERFGDLSLRYVTQTAQRGTADAVLAAAPLIEGPSVVMNGDDFYHRDDLAALAGKKSALLVTQAPDPQNRAVVTLEGDRVTGIVEKPVSPPRDALCSVGAYALEKNSLRLLQDLPLSLRGELELPDFILRVIESSGMGYHEVTRVWFPLTYAWDALSIVHEVFADEEKTSLMRWESEGEENLRRCPGIDWQRPVHVASDVRLGKGCRLVGPVVLGEGCVVGDGARIERSVLFEGVVVGDGARVADSVLGEASRVGSGVWVASELPKGFSLRVKDRYVTPDVSALGLLAGGGATVADGIRVPAGTVLEPGESLSD